MDPARGHELIVAAYVNPEIVTVGRGGECSGCGADNQLALTGIRFRDVRTAFVMRSRPPTCATGGCTR